MSEEDAEIARLQEMQAAQAGNDWSAVSQDQQEESITEHNIESVKRENVADDNVLHSLSPLANAADDDDEYDPSLVVPQPAIALPDSRSSSRASVQKPKKVGGFVADDSDEEEDVQSPAAQDSGVLQVPAPNSSTRTLSPSPLQNSMTQEDLKSPSAQVEQNGNQAMAPVASIPIPSGTGTSVAPAKVAPVNVAAISSAQPKARLPHDTMGLLEDRIKEDPRGDIDAWMSLISEHRGRSKYDEAREVYERFLKLFPHAVSRSKQNF